MRIFVILATLLVVTAGITPDCAAQPCSEIPYSPDFVGSTRISGIPGDTVWVPIWITNETTIVSFVVIVAYQQTVLTPVQTTGEYVLARPAGRFTGSDLFTVQLENDLGNPAVVAHMLPLDIGIDTVAPGTGVVMEIAFQVDPLADIGDDGYIYFPRQTTWVYDSSSTPIDSIGVCRGTNFAVRSDSPSGFEDSWPLTITAGVIVDSIPPVAPTIDYFYVSPRSGYAGENVTARWQVSDADSIVITPAGFTDVRSQGSQSVPLDASGDIVLTAYGLDTAVSRAWPVHVAEQGENRTPYLSSTPYDTVEIIAGDQLYLEMYAFDPDSTIPDVSVSPLPVGAEVIDLGLGGILFDWVPSPEDTGLIALTTYATDAVDPSLVDSIPFWIQVNRVNHPPVWTFNDTTKLIWEGDTLAITVHAQDPDGTAPIIDAHLYLKDTLAENMTFIDSGNGTGVVTFTPDHFQGNLNPNSYGLVFTITDAEDPSMVAQTNRKTILVRNVNTGAEIPTISLSTESDTLYVQETDLLEFEILATTSLGDLPEITGSDLPPGAALSYASGPALANHKRFSWQPDYGTEGHYTATFLAQNGDLIDTAIVDIIVVETNQPPFIYLPPSVEEIVEEDTVVIVAYGIDPDSTMPRFEAFLDGSDTLTQNMTLVDSGNGVASLTFVPNRVQGGCNTEEPAFYFIRFRVIDAEPPYHEVVSSTRSIIVHDSGEPCCIGTRGDVNYDGNGYAEANIADLVRLVDFVFVSHRALPCWWEGDLNGDTSIVVSDLTYLVDYLFRNGAPPTDCPVPITASH